MMVVALSEVGYPGENGRSSNNHEGKGGKNNTANNVAGRKRIAHLDKPIAFHQITEIKGKEANTKREQATGVPTSVIKKWWNPKSLDQYQSLFAEGVLPELPNEEAFNAGIADRLAHENLELIAKSHFHYEGNNYFFITYLVFRNGNIKESGVLPLVNKHNGWKICAVPQAMLGWYKVFWECKASVLEYLVFGKENLLRALDFDQNTKQALQEFRQKHCNDDGELLISGLAMDLNTLEADEPLVANAIFVNPGDLAKPNGISLNQEQKQMFRDALQDIGLGDDEQLTVINTVETEGALAGVVKIRDNSEVTTPKAVEIIESIIGEGYLIIHDSRERQ